MEIKKIEQDLNAFYSAMLRGEEMLASFADEFDSRLGAVKNELKALGDDIPKALKESTKGTPAAGLLNDEINIWAGSLKACAESAEKDINGRQFMHKFEKHPLVVVFGVVKAGKSTLGNFIHGREFRNASFDNPYKTKIPKGRIVIEKKGRDDRDKEQFDENSIESTCSIQYFQIPGLAWVDTPGIAAAERKNDEIPLEQLAKDYVPYADIVVFLATSDHAETRETINGFCSIYNAGKKMIVAITGSDVYEDTGDGEDILVPKDAKTRKLQEDSFKKTLKRAGIKEIQNVDAISISTFLAKQAIENQNDFDWEASNMGEFYRRISDVIGSKEILELKKREPREQMNRSINAILGSKEQKGSLNALISNMESVQKEIEKKYDALKPDGELASWIVDDVATEFSSAIRSHVESATNKKTNNQGKKTSTKKKMVETEVSLAELQETIQKTVSETMEKHIARQIGDFEKVQYDILSTNDLKTTVSCKFRNYTRSYTGFVPRRQDPEWWEFWKDTEWQMEECIHKTPKKVSLGPDTAPAKAELEKKLQSRVEEYVQYELTVLRDHFFGQALSKMKDLVQKLETLKTSLMNYRY